MLGLQVDTARMYDSADPGYIVWLAGVVDRLAASRRRQQKEAEGKK